MIIFNTDFISKLFNSIVETAITLHRAIENFSLIRHLKFIGSGVGGLKTNVSQYIFFKKYELNIQYVIQEKILSNQVFCTFSLSLMHTFWNSKEYFCDHTWTPYVREGNDKCPFGFWDILTQDPNIFKMCFRERDEKMQRILLLVS